MFRTKQSRGSSENIDTPHAYALRSIFLMDEQHPCSCVGVAMPYTVFSCTSRAVACRLRNAVRTIQPVRAEGDSCAVSYGLLSH